MNSNNNSTNTTLPPQKKQKIKSASNWDEKGLSNSNAKKLLSLREKQPQDNQPCRSLSRGHTEAVGTTADDEDVHTPGNKIQKENTQSTNVTAQWVAFWKAS